jgi:cell filamentation protein
LNKISIQFFDDKEVRAVWDDGSSKWWFSVVDIVGVLIRSADPRNYWYVLKNRLKKSGSEVLTNCKRFKLIASDGKRRITDCLTNDREMFMKGIDYSYYYEQEDEITEDDNE